MKFCRAAAIVFAAGLTLAWPAGSASAETTGNVEVKSAVASDGSYEVRSLRLTGTASCLDQPTSTWQIAWALDTEHDGGDVLIVAAGPVIAGLTAGDKLAKGTDPIVTTRTSGVSKHTGNAPVVAFMTVRIVPDGTGPAFQDARLTLSVASVCAPPTVAGTAVTAPAVTTPASAVIPEDIPNSGPPKHFEYWVIAALGATGLGAALRAARLMASRLRS